MKITLPGAGNVSSVEIEWSNETAKALVAALDSGARYTLADYLREANDKDNQVAVVAAAREALQEYQQKTAADALEPHQEPLPDDRGEPVVVAFACHEWDNGYFLTSSATSVFYADGTDVEIDLDDTVLNETLNEAVTGNRHMRYVMSVDLRTNVVEEHDYYVTSINFGLPNPSKVAS